MQHKVKIHYDNKKGFKRPVMWLWTSKGAILEREILPDGEDDFGVYYNLNFNHDTFNFLFKDGKGKDVEWEEEDLSRTYYLSLGGEIWTMGDRHNIYSVRPAQPEGDIRDYYQKIKKLIYEDNFYLPTTDVSKLNVPSMLGANLLKDGSILFSFFHPRAARVYLVGNFNDWQCPGHPEPRRDKFIELELYNGFSNEPNIWATQLPPEDFTEPVEYKFYLQGGAVKNELYTPDPYTRLYSDDYRDYNSVVVNPTEFNWTDQNWETSPVKDLIIYELEVSGFTDNDDDIPEEIQGTFKGVTHRIKEGYFDELGVTAIELMPTTEVPRGRELGYEPCTFMSIEKEFGSPDDFRELVNTAHKHGLAVIADQVFNHTSNEFNPLWNLIDDNTKGGFYFAGETPWGNKVATGKEEVDNMFIDACKLLIEEYHVDGFRFDATHNYFLNHELLYRLAHELKDKNFKPDVILIAENLPNEKDINLEGYNGYAQWNNTFHDKIKALLREGTFEGEENTTENLGTMFYFSKDDFAAHTNNVINYCESHDENSVQFEAATGGEKLQDPEVKKRKAKLGLMATMTALGQPMIYMGQEFGIERERNVIKVSWTKYSEITNQFYHWTKGLINIRKKYDGLKLSSYNPIEEGNFSWVIAPWLDERKGKDKKVIGWRTNDQQEPEKRMLVMFNFEQEEVTVDVDFNTSGEWIKLADIKETINNETESIGSVNIDDRYLSNFVLPPDSGFIYKYQS